MREREVARKVTDQCDDLHEAPKGEEDCEQHRSCGMRFARREFLVGAVLSRSDATDVAACANMRRFPSASIAPQASGSRITGSLRQLLVVWCVGWIGVATIRLELQRIYPAILHRPRVRGGVRVRR